MMRLGLQQRFALALACSALVLLLVLAGLWLAGARSNQLLLAQATQLMRDQALIDLQQRGEIKLRFLAESLPNPVYFYDLQALRDLSHSVLEQPDVQYVKIFDLDGRLLHDGSRTLARFGEVMDDELTLAAVSSNELLLQWRDGLLDLALPIRLGRQRIGGVRIGLSLSSVEAAIAADQANVAADLERRFVSQGRLLLLAFSLLLLAAALAGWLAGRGLVRPIRSLARAAEQLEAGRFDQIQLESRRNDELGKLVQAFSRMAKAIGQHDQDIRRLAYQDPLTGLPNRLMFRELLDDSISDYAAQAQALGLLFIDLDDFKRCNDTLGHDAGDEVLGGFAERLRAQLPVIDSDPGDGKTVIARLGGDEFVALVSGRNISERCQQLAEAILASLTEPFAAGDSSVFLSASIGITLFPEDAHNSKLLLKCGDLAMYQAKLQGKNCFSFYNDGLTSAAEEHLLLEQDLREAMRNDQVRVAYQPIIELSSGRVVGAEALLRWHHPERGDVAPERFVAVAEASSLIEELGISTLRQACRDAVAWQPVLPGVRVGVNVSGRQLLRRDLADLVEQALDETGLPAECLGLELTESSLLHDQVLASSTLGRLRRRGVHIWLDDFGTGFSGLSHLRQAQVDGVKIDRSFVADMETDRDDLALTSAIIAMAHSIGMRAIGEGVETEGQLALLKARGCDYAQGFLFSRPLPVEALISRYGKTANG